VCGGIEKNRCLLAWQGVKCRPYSEMLPQMSCIESAKQIPEQAGNFVNSAGVQCVLSFLTRPASIRGTTVPVMMIPSPWESYWGRPARPNICMTSSGDSSPQAPFSGLYTWVPLMMTVCAGRLTPHASVAVDTSTCNHHRRCEDLMGDFLNKQESGELQHCCVMSAPLFLVARQSISRKRGYILLLACNSGMKARDCKLH